jgi:hypothetical protein
MAVRGTDPRRMEIAGRQAECPNCGAPIAWKLGASAAQVCGHCRFAVVRSDRDLRTIGKVADLVPTAALIGVGDKGQIAGAGFEVLGRLQLDHGKGPWDEWYLGFHDGRWGWLAHAQGKWYLTFVAEGEGYPPFEHMNPGQGGVLPGGGQATWIAQERGTSRVVSAEGELPYATMPGGQGRYVDMVAAGGGFATLDYGDGSTPPRFFVGREYPRDDVQWSAAVGPRPTQQVQVQDLQCPNCGGPCPIVRPDTTERVACRYCKALLDFNQGNLALLEQLAAHAIEPLIPLGQEGSLDGEQLICIGLVERSVRVDGVVYKWREYLLSCAGGYRWLMEDSGHFTYVRSITAADIEEVVGGVLYQGKKHKLFSSAGPRVEHVIGEFYWKVSVGDEARTEDYIRPPGIVSVERTDNEVVWSAGRWVAGKEVWKAFSLPGKPPKPWDVAPAQPNPSKPLIAVLTALLLSVAGC